MPNVDKENKWIIDAIANQIKWPGYPQDDMPAIVITTRPPKECHVNGSLVFMETPETSFWQALNNWCEEVKIAPFWEKTNNEDKNKLD